MAGWLGQKRKSVIISWLISYLSVLLVPIVISSIVYQQSVRIVQEQVLKINNAMIRQLQQMVDEQVRGLETVSMQMATNPKLLELVNNQKKGPIDFDYTEKVKQIFQNFTIYTISNSFIDQFYIFMYESDAVLTANGYYSSKDYYDIFFRGGGEGYESWLNSMRRSTFSEYSVASVSSMQEGEQQKRITLYRTMPAEKDNAKAVLVIYTKNSQISRLMERINWADQDMFFIADRNNQQMYSTAEMVLPPQLQYDRLQPSGVLFTDVDGERMAVSYIRSAAVEWIYLSLTKTSLFNEQVEYIRRLIWICLGLCVGIGGLVAFWFTKKNYNPLQQLIGRITSSTGIRQEAVQNEYRFLDDAFSSALDEKQAFEKRLEQQYAAMRASFLARLVRGRLGQSMPAAEALRSYGITFDGPYFGVILFYVDDYSSLNVYEDDVENLRLAQFIIHNIAEEVLAGPGCRGYVAEVDDLLVCLINLQGAEKARMDGEVEAAILQLQQIMSGKFQVHITSAVSRTHQTIAGIHEAYNEALEAMDYKLIRGKGGLIRYDDIQQTATGSVGSYGYTLATEQILINCIKAGDYAQAEEIIERIIADHVGGGLSVPLAQCLMFDLVSTMIKTLDEISAICEPGFLEELHPAEGLLRCNSFEEMRREMFALLRTVCGYINERSKGVGQAKLKNNMLEFIKDKFSDHNLSLNMIAEHVGVSAKYASSFFKQSTGEGFNYYLNKVRIAEVKRLLLEDMLSIGDIAGKTGFANVSTLIKAFKRYEGVTPGQFREMQSPAQKKEHE